VGSTVEAEIGLPPSVSGELIWKGHRLTLREGKQKLMLR